MSNYYLLYMTGEEIRKHISFHQPRVTLPLAAPVLQVDDFVRPVRVAPDPVALPVGYRVVSLNRTGAGTMTLQQDVVWDTGFVMSSPLLDLTSNKNRAALMRRTLTPGLVGLIAGEYQLLAQGRFRMEEQKLLDHIQQYITARGYYFDRETLCNYHICLKTRPFVILAGLSGTGKSKLSQLYAEALGQKEHYLRLPVRPNWNDDRYLLGHLNAITGKYVTEPAAEFVMRANADPDNLYFFCLDEMNLAHVEYYFSQFLSAMEEEKPEDRYVHLMGERALKELEEQGSVAGVPAKLPIPLNLFFTGTINVDETTQPISDKVIDRANTLEFFSVELDKVPQPSELPDPITLSTFTWQSYQALVPDSSFRTQIIEISKILNRGNLGLGYRVLREIELYLANSKDLLDPIVAFDLQVKQRILPRVRGTEVMIGTMLEELHTFLQQNNLARSVQRLDEMKNRLKRDGYTSFWR